MAISATGGVAGALLLLVTPAKVFSGIVPWLLLFATVLFAVGPAIARLTASASQESHALARWREPGLLAAAIYGGYFNGGLGILLMALYSVTGESRINTANALKNLNSLVLSFLSVAAFILAGAIAWKEGLLMMVAATRRWIFWCPLVQAPARAVGACGGDRDRAGDERPVLYPQPLVSKKFSLLISCEEF